MKIISHRGNVRGPIPEKENRPSYIDCALSNGYDVEIDINTVNGELWLGHDEPQYKVDWEWIYNRNKHLWIHCKNITCLYELTKNKNSGCQYFWHQNDDFTLTNNNFIWTYPGKSLTAKSILVMPEWNTEINDFNSLKKINCHGICTDYPSLLL